MHVIESTAFPRARDAGRPLNFVDAHATYESFCETHHEALAALAKYVADYESSEAIIPENSIPKRVKPKTERGIDVEFYTSKRDVSIYAVGETTRAHLRRFIENLPKTTAPRIWTETRSSGTIVRRSQPRAPEGTQQVERALIEDKSRGLRGSKEQEARIVWHIASADRELQRGKRIPSTRGLYTANRILFDVLGEWRASQNVSGYQDGLDRYYPSRSNTDFYTIFPREAFIHPNKCAAGFRPELADLPEESTRYVPECLFCKARVRRFFEVRLADDKAVPQELAAKMEQRKRGPYICGPCAHSLESDALDGFVFKKLVNDTEIKDKYENDIYLRERKLNGMYANARANASAGANAGTNAPSVSYPFGTAPLVKFGPDAYFFGRKETIRDDELPIRYLAEVEGVLPVVVGANMCAVLGFD